MRFWTNGGIVALGNARVTLEDLDMSSISAGPGVFVGNSCNATRVRVSGTHCYLTVAGANSQWSGVLLDDTITATNSSAWSNFGQP